MNETDIGTETADDIQDGDFAWNYQMDGPFIRGRTAHRIAERDGREITAECGFSWTVSTGKDVKTDESDFQPADRHKCGNCPWDAGDGGE